MANPQDSGSSFQDALLKSQKEFFESWTDAAARFYKALEGTDGWPSATKNVGDVFGLYESWKEGFGRYFDVLTTTHPLRAGAGVLPKLLGSSDVTMRLYQFWEPLVRALQEKAFASGSYKDLLEPGKIAEMTDRVFGFGPTTSVADFYGQAAHLAETWGSRAQDFVRPWAEAVQKSADASLGLASGDPEARMKVFDHLYSAFQETFGKALKMPAVGKDRELTELLLRTIDRYNVFLAKNAEFQHEIHKIAQQAMEEVVEIVAQRVRDGEEAGGIEDFSKIWAQTNEKAFLELFQTDQFARLQGLLLDAALDARRHMQRLMEHYLKDFPIALRSEMDDIYKTSHGLNRSVRALSRKSSEIDAMREEIRRLEERVAALEKSSSGADEVPADRPGEKSPPRKGAKRKAAKKTDEEARR